MYYKETNVFDEALSRIRMLFDTHEDIIVSMSGGKDSTVLFHLALMVAKEKDRLPLKVFWLDQEAEWQATVDYMDKLMRMPEVEPYWYQIPFEFTNSLSAQTNFLSVFDESCKEKWIHQKSDISIKENPTKYNRFHDLVSNLPKAITDKECAVLIGMRISESPARRITIVNSNAKWHGITWCSSLNGNIRKFWPIYDFTDSDIWTALAKNHWEYNKVYDMMYQYGVPKTNMRVSALIHETAWRSMGMLQEFEPKTYNKFVARVCGSSTFSHVLDGDDLMPKTLPIAFKDWKEYRDYLLVHITKPEYWELFRKRWKNQDSEDWYGIHVREIIVNDIDGTINKNYKLNKNTRITSGKYEDKHRKQFEEYMKGREEDD